MDDVDSSSKLLMPLLDDDETLRSGLADAFSSLSHPLLTASRPMFDAVIAFCTSIFHLQSDG